MNLKHFYISPDSELFDLGVESSLMVVSAQGNTISGATEENWGELN